MTPDQRLEYIESQNREILAMLRLLLPRKIEKNIMLEAERRPSRKQTKGGNELCQQGTVFQSR